MATDDFAARTARPSAITRPPNELRKVNPRFKAELWTTTGGTNGGQHRSRVRSPQPCERNPWDAATSLCAVSCWKYRDSVGSARVPEEVYLPCRRCMIPQYAQVASVGRRSDLRSSEPWEIEALA